jgi:enoyl-CoA hydratase
MTAAPVQLSIRDDVAHLVLANPPKNLMDRRFFDALTTVCQDALLQPLRGMIIYGSGRHFSCGADLGELRQIVAGNQDDFLHDNLVTLRAIESLRAPVVAAINGCCLGAGLELALACHHRIATAQAVFALPESTFGIMPGCGGSVRLPALVGKSRAIELILTGRIFGADEALELGVIDRIVDKKEMLDLALATIADSVGRLQPLPAQFIGNQAGIS